MLDMNQRTILLCILNIFSLYVLLSSKFYCKVLNLRYQIKDLNFTTTYKNLIILAKNMCTIKIRIYFTIKKENQIIDWFIYLQ